LTLGLILSYSLPNRTGHYYELAYFRVFMARNRSDKPEACQNLPSARFLDELRLAFVPQFVMLAALKHCTALHTTHYPLTAAGVWADCVRLKRPVMHNDYQALPDKKGYPEGHSPVYRHLSLPVLVGDQARLVIGVGNKTLAYNDHDILTLQVVANELHKIIKRKQVEAALRVSEAKYRHLHTSIRDAFASVTMDGRLQDFNDAFQNMLGYTRAGSPRASRSRISPMPCPSASRPSEPITSVCWKKWA